MNCKDCLHFNACVHNAVVDEDYQDACSAYDEKVKDKPVVLGEWMYDDSCSECGKWANWNYKFCPNCGVKMKNPEKGR